ncbi:MAG: VWA domain-containing protein [Gaiellales bacterium]
MNMNRRVHLHGAGALAMLVAAAMIAVFATGASAAADSWHAPNAPVTITQVDTSSYPKVRVAYGADDVRGEMPKLTYYENGVKVNGVKFYRGPIGSYENRRRTEIMLALDTSLSMGMGTRLTDAKAAANQLIAHARPGDRIGLTTFGGSAKVVVHPTDDHGRVSAALEGVKLANRTTMFDGVSKSAQAFEGGKTTRAIVLLSDGTDAGSLETIDEAIGEALKAQSPIYAVAIRENEDVRPTDLAALANGTSGELQMVIGSTGLDTIFNELGRRILQPYWIEYTSSYPVRSRIQVGIATGGSIVAKQSFRAIPVATGGGAAMTSPPPAPKPPDPVLPIPSGLTGVFLAALPFGILIFLGVWTFLQRRSTPDVLARIERYTARASAVAVAQPRKNDTSLARRLATPMMRLGETLLGGSAFFARTRLRAEQAAIAIKPSELFAVMVAAGAFGLFLAFLVNKLLLWVLLPLVFGFAPNFWLRMRARKRRNLFEDQLADVLQNISSSLQAGHSFNQSLNAMTKDAPNPTAEEFSRVMTEARLGMPTEDALQHMADRMGSADFDFAVTTVNIQRTVGGSLADILEMVGDTVRNRQQFRKKVKALTSMGQMSAYVLLAMPVFMAGSISLLNYEYMAPLYETTAGHLMMAAGTFSMFLGYLACMKIVKVKV